MRYIMLDLDGVLTTGPSRSVGGPSNFDARAVKQIERLLSLSQASVIIHSSWRKLPEAHEPPWTFPPPDDWWYWSLPWFRELCRSQDAHELASRVDDVAPFRMTDDRGREVYEWMVDNHVSGNSYVVLDDQVELITSWLTGRDDVFMVKTNDGFGLTSGQVDMILAWWDKENA